MSGIATELCALILSVYIAQGSHEPSVPARNKSEWSGCEHSVLERPDKWDGRKRA